MQVSTMFILISANFWLDKREKCLEYLFIINTRGSVYGKLTILYGLM
jgi:hypothetical protein